MTANPDATVLLYVEDDKLIQETMVPVLEDAGFAVLVADNGTDAIDCIATEKGAIDALVTDVNLGRGPTGWNVARRARLRTATMPIVYLSSVQKDAWMVNGVPLSQLISKPSRPSHIVSAISALVAAPATLI